MRQSKYIIFKADKSQPGWKERKLQHTQGLTGIIAEYFDYTGKPVPEPGFRPTQFIRKEDEHDPDFHAHSTHYKYHGDWEVTRVEVYEHSIGRPASDYDMVVICYCQYNPINSEFKPMPSRVVSVDSFGGNEVAYQEYLGNQD